MPYSSYKDLRIDFPNTPLVTGMNLVLGESGTGKTTYLKALAGLVPSVELELASTWSFMAQDPVFPDDLKVKEVLTLFAGMESSRALGALKQWGLRDKANVFPRFLSVGQRQRLQYIIARAKDCAHLLLDEPTSALDDDWAMKMIADLDHYLSAHPLAKVVVVSHDPRLKDHFESANTISFV